MEDGNGFLRAYKYIVCGLPVVLKISMVLTEFVKDETTTMIFKCKEKCRLGFESTTLRQGFVGD